MTKQLTSGAAPVTGDALRATLRVTKALADLQRVRSLMMLRPGEMCVCQIIEMMKLAPSTVSKHLSLLAGAGLVDSRRDGRWSYYRLPDGATGAFVIPVLKWLNDVLDEDARIMADKRKLSSVMAMQPDTLCQRQRERKPLNGGNK